MKTSKQQKLFPLSYRAAAQALGVTTAHLWLTLNGKRESRRLMAAYEALVRRENAKRAGGKRPA